jgi:hypothetical protein
MVPGGAPGILASFNAAGAQVVARGAISEEIAWALVQIFVWPADRPLLVGLLLQPG